MAHDYRKLAGELAIKRGEILHKRNLWNNRDYLNYRDQGFQPTFPRSADTPTAQAITPTAPAAEYQESQFTTTAPALEVLPVKESLPVNTVEPESVNISLLVKESLPPASVSTSPNMKFSTFHHKKHSKATPLMLNSDELITMLATHHVRPSKDGKLFTPAAFNGSRGNRNFVSASAICLDSDKGQPTIEGVLAVFPDALAAFYTTHSHTLENPRFRIVIPLSRSVNADEHALLVLGIKSIIPLELMECIDQSCFERARPHYFPSCPPEYESHAKAGHQEGQPLDVEHFLRLGNAVEVPAAPAKTPPPVKVPLPVETADTAIQVEPVNEKKRPSYENWHTQVYPREFSTDAWRALNRNATAIMVLITCRAKHGQAAADRTKKFTGTPTWSFTVKQAETQLKFTRPTFIKAMALLQEVGFIENVRAGNYGSNTPALYRMSEKWMLWKQPESDNTNIIKARSMRKKRAV